MSDCLRPRTAFSLAEPASGRVSVFDALGREVRVLDSGALDAEPHRMPLATFGLASGVYVVRVQTERSVGSRTISVIR